MVYKIDNRFHLGKIILSGINIFVSLIDHNFQIIYIFYQKYMDTLYNIIVMQDMLIPVGSRKRIIRAIKDRRSDLESDRPIEDSRL